MLGDTASGGGAATANPHYHHQHQIQPLHHNPNNPQIPATELAGHVGSSSGGEEDRFGGSGGGGGNRWPRPETVALLKIRTDMDATFRDSSVKGPLWDEVSRKMAELGYHRSSKKCREKFENVYKYHKRTKDGRTAKHDGAKTYRFFQELEAFDGQAGQAAPPPLQLQIPPPNQAPPPPPPQQQQQRPPVQLQIPAVNQHHPPPPATVPSTTVVPTSTVLPPQTPGAAAAINIAATAGSLPPNRDPYPPSFSDLMSNSTSSSSSTSSDAEIRHRRGKRKRKWKELFDRLMSEVVGKQEEMQRKFLEAIEKREKDRINREEHWRSQEMARINREREILAQERSIAASKDAAVMSFLQKLSDHHIPTAATPTATNPPPPPPQVVHVTPPPPPQPSIASIPPPAASIPSIPPPETEHREQSRPTQTQLEQSRPTQLEQSRPIQPLQPLQPHQLDIADRNSTPGASSSRWPKVEIEALIDLRKHLDSKYQEIGPKGPLWEEISSRMKQIGYNRSAKRCKEKWENINKYFKKVKESNKKRPEDSKTCPYFHQLDALYRERQSNSVPILVQPEQQWPPVAAAQPAQQDMESEGDDGEDDEDDDEEGGGGYEVVANKGNPANN